MPLPRRVILGFPIMALAPAAARAQGVEGLIGASEVLLRRFRDDGAWSQVWRVLGGAEGVLVAPRISAAGLFVVDENGQGLVLARHGMRWSDPVGVQLSETSVGLEGGVREFGLLLAVLSRPTLQRLIAGGVSYGGDGGFALGSLGLGTSAGLGTSGIDTLAVTVSESGAFAGSGVGGMKLAPLRSMNEMLHGADVPPETVLGRDGRHGSTERLRALLAEATRAHSG